MHDATRRSSLRLFNICFRWYELGTRKSYQTKSRFALVILKLISYCLLRNSVRNPTWYVGSERKSHFYPEISVVSRTSLDCNYLIAESARQTFYQTVTQTALLSKHGRVLRGECRRCGCCLKSLRNWNSKVFRRSQGEADAVWRVMRCLATILSFTSVWEVLFTRECKDY